MKMMMMMILLLCALLSVTTRAASFTKRYCLLSPSATGSSIVIDHRDEATVFRLHKSRMRQWQQKQRRRTNRRRWAFDYQQAAVSSGGMKTTTTTSGSRIFWGKPSIQGISKRFWNAATPKFNNPNAGRLTHPALSTSSYSSSSSSSSTTPSSSSYTSNKQNSIQSSSSSNSAYEPWWPDLPALSIASGSKGKEQTSFKTTTRALKKGTDVFFRYISSNVMSYRVLRYQLRVGQGLDCYERVRDFALAWEFDSPDKGIKNVQQQAYFNPQQQQTAKAQPCRSVHPLQGTTASADRTEGLGRRMVSWTKVGPFHVLSPIAVLYEWVDHKGLGSSGARTLYTSCAYATQKGHWLAGEERVTVALRETDDPLTPAPVDVEIVSFSKAAPSLIGILAWPFVGRMQDKFFVEQLRALHRVGTGPSQHKTGENKECQFINIVGPRGKS